jgi:N4-gp56 family major capsid protein
MANEITRVTTQIDQRKAVAAKLLQRAHLRLVTNSICDKVAQERGTGIQTTFIRYKRMPVPLSTLTEGVPPPNNTISVEQVVSTLDQWGDVVTITDVAQLTTLHPLVSIAQTLLADNAQRVIDRETQLVMLAGTNVFYGDTSVSSRSSITQSMTISDTIIHKATLTMLNAGAPPRFGPSNMLENARGQPASGEMATGGHYLAIMGGEVRRDIMRMAAASNLWVNVTQYQNAKRTYVGEVGDYLGLRIVETNFIPRFRRLGNKTPAAPAGPNAGGITGLSLAIGTGTLGNATYYWKVTRKDTTRGFEEDISIEHSTATGGATKSLQFTLPSTPGYVYNIYVGSSSGDANLFLAAENQPPGEVVNVTSVPSGTANPPASNRAAGDSADPDTIHPVYIIAEQALAWVGLQNLQTYIQKGGDKSDPLDQVTKIGYKFMAKACRLDEARLLRLELASNF